jgi:hypothetical protein
LTSVVDDATPAVVGWAIALTPHTGTVLTALWMALVPDESRGPREAVPTMVRVDRGLQFAATAVRFLTAPTPAIPADRAGQLARQSRGGLRQAMSRRRNIQVPTTPATMP